MLLIFSAIKKKADGKSSIAFRQNCRAFPAVYELGRQKTHCSNAHQIKI